MCYVLHSSGPIILDLLLVLNFLILISLVFVSLLTRSYEILQSTRKDYDPNHKDNKGTIIRYSVLAAVFLLFLIIRSGKCFQILQFITFNFLVVSRDHPIKSYDVVINDGVLIQQTYICESDNWEFAILGIEALTLIVGVGLGVQVRLLKYT